MFRNVFNAYPMQRLMMVNTVFVGLCDLQKFFYIYEQFISVLWNFFFIDNVRKSLWNSAQVSNY